MTAQDIIDSALRKLAVIQPGESPSSDERNTGLAAFNLMIGTWNEALAKALAGSYASVLYTFVPLASNYALLDTVAVSLGFLKAFQYNLAVDLAPEFGAQVPAEVAAVASEARKAIFTIPAPAGV